MRIPIPTNVSKKDILPPNDFLCIRAGKYHVVGVIYTYRTLNEYPTVMLLGCEFGTIHYNHKQMHHMCKGKRGVKFIPFSKLPDTVVFDYKLTGVVNMAYLYDELQKQNTNLNNRETEVC